MTSAPAPTLAGRDDSGRRTYSRRRPLLVVHVLCSAGLLGMYLTMLVLGISALTTTDDQLGRATYMALGRIGLVVVPVLTVANLLSGLLIATNTRWGILRHKWVLTKLGIALVIVLYDNFVLAPRLKQTAHLASQLARPLSSNTEGIVSGVVGITLVTIAAVLAVYKPWGRTHFGQKRPSPDEPG